jgi:hypothetical protein
MLSGAQASIHVPYHVCNDVQVNSDVVEFVISSEAAAVFVNLETSLAGNFSSSGFAVTPWAPLKITFRGQNAVSAEHFAEELTLHSLFEAEVGPGL